MVYVEKANIETLRQSNFWN